jgi:hypothetical protein
MTINIQKATNVNAIGIHMNGNAKPVFCITDGSVYASVTDAADKNGTTVASMSCAVTGKIKTCKGKRYCFISDVMRYLDEISENIKIRNEKVAAYDAIMAEQKAQWEREEAERRQRAEAQENLAKHKAKCEELRAKLEKEMALMQEAESIVNGGV